MSCRQVSALSGKSTEDVFSENMEEGMVSGGFEETFDSEEFEEGLSGNSYY